uniref:Uncharacterized protein n=1 Tax=Leptocylindrus danicus TaxID=163516 RepID=A0A7S2NTR3_9STRA|mmetsp:Transcript_11674/g.17629  ORF Transcript_11674/g.17629 Transcript_11674/m.17629 type:complete len:237 (+) Transcript_11674:81-791(+)
MCNTKVSPPPLLLTLPTMKPKQQRSKSKPVNRATRKIEGARIQKSASNIRNDYLNKLGIPRNGSTALSEQFSAPNCTPTVPIHPIIRLNKEREYIAPLHIGGEQDAGVSRGSPRSVAQISDVLEQQSLDSSHNGSSFNSNVAEFLNCPKKRGVTFNSQVKVVPIAMRDDYTDRIRARMWNNAEMILENAHRNIVEFNSEGWCWRQCVEEHHMYTCSITGERIHPVHCGHMPVGTYH